MTNRRLTPHSVLISGALSMVAGLLAAQAMAATPTPSTAANPVQGAPVTATQPADPYLWLEDVGGDRSLDWVRKHNAKTVDKYTKSADFKKMEEQIRASLDSNANIPGVTKMGDLYYNVWRDKANPIGLWRRTTLEEYRKKDPKWETVLDFDALAKAENENWVFKGVNCPRPYERCMISLSRGGADAVVVREFDLNGKAFVKDGFVLPEAKGNMGFIDRDTVFVATDFGQGSLTESGYPRVVKMWKRGTPLSDAKVIYEGKDKDMSISASHDTTPGFERNFVFRAIEFYNNEMFELKGDGSLVKIDVPNTAEKNVVRDWLIVRPRFDYTVNGKTFKSGSVLAARYADFMAGKRDFQAIFTPDAQTSLDDMEITKDYIVLNTLKDVKGRLQVLRIPQGHSNEWTTVQQPGLPEFGRLGIRAVDSDDSNALWFTNTDFLTPTTLSWLDIGQAPQALKQDPTWFDSKNLEVQQHFATSKDGTRIPYFIVKRKDLKNDGNHPTLLYGYGGFEVSMLPAYSGRLGMAWLDKGGTYVLANIRGGGEYGPAWHQAVVKENRPKVYQDFAAVAQDLIQRKITSPKHLGIQGGSNGGLLTGNMLTQYPELFGAVVIQVPLLDMKRYKHLPAGASWMAEYGDPDTSDWNYIRKFSPYHLFDAKRNYPPTLITTSTRDDRVHPGHARKFMAKMDAANKDVYYYENIEGGHGGAANNAQAAFMTTLAYAFLWDQLK